MKYYSSAEIDATGANYRIIFGERSNGKTYDFKVHNGFDNWMRTGLEKTGNPEDGEQFAYVRYSVEEVKPKRVSTLFEDCREYMTERLRPFFPDIATCWVSTMNGCFTLYWFDKREEKHKIDVIGYYFALNQQRYAKSAAFPRITRMALDEFICREAPSDGFEQLINLVSTIKRKRTNFIVYLLGNTITRNNPILDAMSINLRDIHKGEIKCYEYSSTSPEGEEVHNRVAIEYCGHYEQSVESEAFFTFGTQRELMIINGAWETEDYQKFEDADLECEDIKIALILQSKGFRLFCYIAQSKNVYVSYNRYKSYKGDYVTLTVGRTYPNRKVFNWKTNNKKIKRVEEILEQAGYDNHVFFSDNLTGDDYFNFLAEVNIL